MCESEHTAADMAPPFPMTRQRTSRPSEPTVDRRTVASGKKFQRTYGPRTCRRARCCRRARGERRRRRSRSRESSAVPPAESRAAGSGRGRARETCGPRRRPQRARARPPRVRTPPEPAVTRPRANVSTQSFDALATPDRRAETRSCPHAFLERRDTDRARGQLDLTINEVPRARGAAAEASPSCFVTGRSPMRKRRSVPPGVVTRTMPRASRPRAHAASRGERNVVGLEQRALIYPRARASRVRRPLRSYAPAQWKCTVRPWPVRQHALHGRVCWIAGDRRRASSRRHRPCAAVRRARRRRGASEVTRELRRPLGRGRGVVGDGAQVDTAGGADRGAQRGNERVGHAGKAHEQHALAPNERHSVDDLRRDLRQSVASPWAMVGSLERRRATAQRERIDERRAGGVRQVDAARERRGQRQSSPGRTGPEARRRAEAASNGTPRRSGGRRLALWRILAIATVPPPIVRNPQPAHRRASPSEPR